MPKLLVLILLTVLIIPVSDARSSDSRKRKKPIKTADQNAKLGSYSGQTKLSKADARHFLARTHFSVDLDTVDKLAGKSRNYAIQWLFNQQNFAAKPAQPRWLKGFDDLVKKVKKEDAKLTIQDLDLVLGDLKEEPQLKRGINSL